MAGDVVAVLKLQADGKGFVGEIRRVEKAVGGLSGAEKKVAGATRTANAETSRQTALIKQNSAALGGAQQSALRYGAAFVSVAAAHRALGSITDKTIRQEQAMAQVEARIRSTGGAAGHTAGELGIMAANFQRVTTYGDEEILELQSTLLSFRGIGREAFGGATEATLNLATALRTDLRSAVLQVGKALDNPVRGLDGLSRSGTQFTDEQKAMVKQLVSVGKKAEAQALILKELEVQYGGSARAARDNFGGALKSLGNAFGDLQEVSGEGTSGITEMINDLTDTLADVDVAELHSDLAAIGKVALVVGTALGGKAALGLSVWTAKLAKAKVVAQAKAFNTLGAARATDRARVAHHLGAPAAARWGRQIGVASTAARGMGKSLALISGPAGWAALAAYGIYQFATATDEAERKASSFDGLLSAASKRQQAEQSRRDAAPAAGGPVAAWKAQVEKLRGQQKELREGAQKLETGTTARYEKIGTTGYSQYIAAVAPTDEELAEAATARTEIKHLETQISAAYAEMNRALSAQQAAPTIDRAAQNIIDSFIPARQQIEDEADARIATLKAERERVAAHARGATAAGEIDTAITAAQAQKKAALAEHDAKETAMKQRLAQEQRSRRESIRQLTEGDATRKAILQSQQAGELQRLQSFFSAEQQAGEEYQAAVMALELRHGNQLSLLKQELDAEEASRQRDQRENELAAREEHFEDLLAQSRGFADREAQQDHDAAQQRVRQRLEGATEEQTQIVLGAHGLSASLNNLRDRDAELETARAGTNAEATATAEQNKKDAQLTTANQALALGSKTALAFAGRSKKAFKLHQAAAIGTALINTYTAATEAIKQGGPIAGPVLAASITALGLTQVAQIRAQQPPAAQGFRLGGVIDSPTYFSAPGIPLGVGGEAGPEVILPLQRGSGGRLGVQAVGGGRSIRNTITIAPTIQVSAGTGADGQAIGDAAAEQVIASVYGVIEEEMRPGGILDIDRI